MPTVTDTSQVVWAHCRNARCPGYTQEEIQGFREEHVQTFGENGGDGIFMPMTERSMVSFRAESQEDVPCHACGQPRDVTGEPRPAYQPISGHDPLGLIGGLAFDPQRVNTEQDAQIAELQATVARLAALVEVEDVD